jgi:serpin B
MYLVNALTFDAAWKEIYTTDQVRPGEFHSPAGTLSVDMLHSEEHTYLEDDYATGFMKDYEGDQYSFFAMVPKDGTSVKEYLENLTAESLTNTIANAQQTTVFAAMPKFRGESSVEAAEVLKEMGMVDAFTAEADFSGIEAGKNLWIGRVLHKTYLQVDEAGTQAGAVTIEEFLTKGFILNAKSVTLDRPFVMGIYDKINGCFLFLGAVETPNQANA